MLDPIVVEYPDCKPYHLVPSISRARAACRVTGRGILEIAEMVQVGNLDVGIQLFCIFAGCETDRQVEEVERRIDEHGWLPAMKGLGQCLLALINRTPENEGKQEQSSSGK